MKEATIISLFATSDAHSILGVDDPKAGLPPSSEKGKGLHTKHDSSDIA